MNNVKSVMNYFDGNFLFNLYLKNIIGNTNDESYMYEDNLLNDINKNAVIMGCICNIMTSIKDGLNDKTNNFNKYFSEIVNKELSDNILMIASKNKDGYVIDDYTLEVTLEAPTTYFPQLLAFPTYAPLREVIVSADPEGWATEPETYVSNGAFKLVQWDMKDQLVFEKNEEYWNAKEIKIPGVVWKLVTDENTAYASLKSGEFDAVHTVPVAEIANGQ